MLREWAAGAPNEIPDGVRMMPNASIAAAPSGVPPIVWKRGCLVVK